MLLPYSSPTTAYRHQIEIKKSLFITDIIPVHTVEEASQALSSIKKEMHDATHHCYAHRIGTKQPIEKSSDDGEPSGTAGHPILHVLQANELTFTLAVVTRYFGGIKLGTGGLARAYAQGVADGIKQTTIARYTPHIKNKITFAYSALGAIEHYMADTDIRILTRDFTHKVSLTLLWLPENEPTHTQAITDMTHGQIEIQKLGEEYIPLPQK